MNMAPILVRYMYNLFFKNNLLVICLLMLTLGIREEASANLNPFGKDRIAAADSIKPPSVFIHTGFENASPANWEVDSAGRVIVSLVYDHERFSPNRANNHWHFKIMAPVGTEVTIVLRNFENVWNNQPSRIISKRSRVCVSYDKKKWESRETKIIDDNKLTFNVIMQSESAWIASVEPYTVTDLANFLATIKSHPLVNITQVGKTVEGRPLEVIRIGSPAAPRRIFIRARAHAFEAGGNWTVEGLIKRMLKNDAEIKKYLKRYCLYIMPMANKDGVVRGKTRFNANGFDLNRKWDKLADPEIAPENYAVEMWLSQMIRDNKKPDLAIDLHNDPGGQLHITRRDGDHGGYLSNMEKLEMLLRKHTWFTEGSTKATFRNPGSLGDGLLERYGVHAVVYELNYEWIAGLNKAPLAADWLSLGGKLPEVFYNYFEN